MNKFTGLIFSVAFIGCGTLFAFKTVVPMFLSWQEMRSWQPVDAQLHQVKWSKEETIVNYRYTVNQVVYSNDQISIFTPGFEHGDYHQKQYRQLKHLQNKAETVLIWYNPSDPAQSMIDREMPWGTFVFLLVFASVFILIGTFVICCHLGEPAPSSELNKKVSVPIDPEQPWLAKKEWRNNRIASDIKTRMYSLWLFVILIFGLCIPLFNTIQTEINHERFSILIALFLPLFGLLLLKWAWKKSRDWHRFGSIELQMDPFPGSIGGQVGGYFLLKKANDLSGSCSVELSCVYSYLDYPELPDPARYYHTVWCRKARSRIKPSASSLIIAFIVNVPDQLPEADIHQDDGNYHFWRLTLKALVDGIEIKRNYNIPVFPTQTQSSISPDSAQAALESAAKAAGL